MRGINCLNDQIFDSSSIFNLRVWLSTQQSMFIKSNLILMHVCDVIWVFQQQMSNKYICTKITSSHASAIENILFWISFNEFNVYRQINVMGVPKFNFNSDSNRSSSIKVFNFNLRTEFEWTKIVINKKSLLRNHYFELEWFQRLYFVHGYTIC